MSWIRFIIRLRNGCLISVGASPLQLVFITSSIELCQEMATLYEYIAAMITPSQFYPSSSPFGLFTWSL